MKIIGNAQLAADRATVWKALNDPAVLVRAIPGCERLEEVGDDAYAMSVAAGVGSIKGVYDGQVRLSDQQHPGSFRMHADGAGAGGTIGADVLVTLEEVDDGTSLTYEADATVGGMIGGVGQRMLVGVSKRMAAEFFDNVSQLLEAGPEPEVEPAGGHQRMPLVYRDAAPGRMPRSRAGFGLGVAAGATAALAGALVGAWFAGRRSR